MRPIRFGYEAFTLFDSPSQVILLQIDLLPNSISQSYNPTYVVWAPPRSLAATWGISVDFYSRVT